MHTTLTPKDLARPVSQIGKALRDARDARDLSRNDAARQIGIDPQTLYRWETSGAIERAEVGSVLRAESFYGIELMPLLRKRLGINVPRGTSGRMETPKASERAARLVVQAKVAALVGDDEEAEARYMRIIDNAMGHLSAFGAHSPADRAALIESIGEGVVEDIEDRKRRGVPL